MKKILSLSCFVLLALGTVLADDISREQALQIASQFVTNSQPRLVKMKGFRTLKQATAPTVAYVLRSQMSDKDNVYVVNLGNDQGFVVVAGETVAEDDVLGYCDHGSFSYDSCPVQLKGLLANYSNAIDSLRKNPALAMKSTLKAKADIGTVMVGPLLTTTWDQWAPYNMFCPEDCPTGCYPTALAQLMNYWKWPKESMGKIRVGDEYVDFSGHVYDWENMDDDYSPYNYEQAVAVAELMADIGKAFGTDYTPEASRTPFIYEPLITNFGYNLDDEYGIELHRDTFASGLMDVMRAELDKQRPMLYCGGGLVGEPHALVCDGYTSADYFHFNYGWGGDGDGFYKNAICTFFADVYLYTGIRPYDPAIKEIGDYKYELVKETGCATIYDYLKTGGAGATLDIPSTVTDTDGTVYKVTRIRRMAFYGKGQFEKVTMGDNIESVDPFSFANTRINEVVLSDNLEQVPDNAFQLTGVKKLTIGKNVRRIGKKAFYMCPLTEVISRSPAFEVDDAAFAISKPDCGDWLGCITSLGDSAFFSATFVDKEPVFSNLVSIGDRAFANARFPRDNFKIPATLRHVEPTAFSNALTAYGVLASLEVSDENPYFSGGGAFLFNKNKSSLVLLMPVYSDVGGSLLEFPTNMVKMEPGCVSSRVTSFGSYYYEVTIPNTILELDNAFINCETLGDLTCQHEVPPVITDTTFNEKIFENSPNITLHVPYGAEELYANALGWSRFPNIVGDQDFTPLPDQGREYTMIVTTSDADGQQRVSIPVSEVASMEIAADGQHVIIHRNGKDDLTTTVTSIDSISWLPGFVYENAEVFALNDSTFTVDAQKCSVSFSATCVDDDVQLCVRNMVLKPDVVEGVTRGFAVDFSLSNDEHQLSGVADITIPVSLSADEIPHAAYYNTETGEWEPVCFTYDEENGTITITTNHLSTYSVFYTLDGSTMDATLNFYEIAPHIYTFDQAMQNILTIVSSDNPDDKMIQEFKSDLQFWQSVGLDGLWNVIRGTGEAVCDFRPEKLDKLVEGMGYLGTALSILDVAAADIKGDNVGVASGTLSTIMNFATGQMASAIGTPVMTVSMAGVAFIGIALNKFGTTIQNATREYFREAYHFYYSKAGYDDLNGFSKYYDGNPDLNTGTQKYPHRYFRTPKDWYDYFYPVFAEGKMNKSQLDAYIEQSVRMYCNRFWDDNDAVRQSAYGEAKMRGLYSTHDIDSEPWIKEQISNEYFAELMNGEMVRVIEAIRDAIKVEAENRYRKALKDVAEMMNTKLSLRFSDSSCKEGEKSKFAGWKVRFTELPSTLSDAKGWEKTIKENGTLGYGYFTEYALVKNNVKTQVTLYDLNGVEQKTYDFQIPDGTGKQYIYLDLATGGMEIEVPRLQNLVLAYDPVEVVFPATFAGPKSKFAGGEKVYFEGGIEEGKFLLNDVLHKNSRFQTEIERFFKQHDFITIDNSGHIKIGDDVVGMMEDGIGSGKFTINTAYKFTENKVEDFVDVFNGKNPGNLMYLFSSNDVLSGTLKHKIDCDFTLVPAEEEGAYVVSYTGSGTYDISALVVNRVENVDWDHFSIQGVEGVFEQHISVDDIRTAEINQQGSVSLKYTVRLK
ncbi:MAG: C10 family peptidase [Bacteroidales bacterium]|nr:C10 family peptidase [Bacteroidales bacterium]